jgi:hypothetical protein
MWGFDQSRGADREAERDDQQAVLAKNPPRRGIEYKM